MPTIVRIWILLSALLGGGGWLLSALHLLNRAGYAGLAVMGLVVLPFVLRSETRPGRPARRPELWRKWRGRFRRPAPRLFLVIFGLSILGAVLYHPTNGDTLAYRIPRIYHWLAAEHWHWIPTLDARMNIAGCGYEWLAAPGLLFLKSDRLFFLPNLISYLLLPGLLFRVFIQLGLRPRVAWWWMWLGASGWCYALQAVAAVNDSFATIYALAAVDFALRARRSGRVTELWLAILAAALLTGAKQTAIPLVLIVFLAVLPSVRLLFQRPLASLFVIAWGVLASALPIFYFNFHYTGSWTGLPPNVGPESPLWGNSQLPSMFWGVVGNAFALPLQNLLPPVFPWADQWFQLLQRFLHTPFGAHFLPFESFAMLSQSVSDTSAGIGLAVSGFLVISLAAGRGWTSAGNRRPLPGADKFLLILRIAPWVSLLYFMGKVGTYQNARQLAPYYVLLLPLLLTGRGQELLTRRRWWRRLACLVMLSTVGILIVDRARPMFPARTILALLRERHPDSRALARISASYSIRDSLRALDHLFADQLPATETVIGYATVTCGCEPGLWQPFTRRVERVLPNTTGTQLRQRGIHYVAVDFTALAFSRQTIAEWAAKMEAEIIAEVSWELHAGIPPGKVYLVRLK